MNNKTLYIIISLIFFSSCIHLDIDLRNLKTPVFYSDIKSNSSKAFEIDHTNFYFYSLSIREEKNKTVEQLLFEVMQNNPSAKGIKNLQVTFYNKSWLSYGIFPNPLGIITSTFILIGNLIGFSNKSIYIKGELYY
jgi:hypothetical protein